MNIKDIVLNATGIYVENLKLYKKIGFRINGREKTLEINMFNFVDVKSIMQMPCFNWTEKSAILIYTNSGETLVALKVSHLSFDKDWLLLYFDKPVASLHSECREYFRSVTKDYVKNAFDIIAEVNIERKKQIEKNISQRVGQISIKK